MPRSSGPRRSRRGKRVFEQDFNGVGDLLRSPGVDADLQRRASAVAAHAISNAPVDTGEYRDSINIERDETDRVRWNVISHAPHANNVEFLHQTLGNAIDAAGGS